MQKEQGWDISILCCSCEKKIKTKGHWLSCLCGMCLSWRGGGWGHGARGLNVLTAWVTVLASASWRQAGSLALVTWCWLEWVSLPGHVYG